MLIRYFHFKTQYNRLPTSSTLTLVDRDAQVDVSRVGIFAGRPCERLAVLVGTCDSPAVGCVDVQGLTCKQTHQIIRVMKRKYSGYRRNNPAPHVKQLLLTFLKHNQILIIKT